MSDGALISLLTLLVRGTQLGAFVGPGPHSGFLAELLRVAVSVTMAVLFIGEALANSVIAVHAVALPGVAARTAVVEVD
jgi:hypothetical protein